MEININKKPRTFKVGIHRKTKIKDCGKINLNPDEMVSFINNEGHEYDIVSKDWGFYATPSINKRLLDEGYKTALVKNSFNQFYIMLVDKNKMDKFKKYCIDDKQTVIEWLDERS